MNWNYARYATENLEKYGEYVFLIYEEEGLEQHFTNSHIQRQSSALANGLNDLGVRPGDVVAVILPNGPSVPIAFSGIFKMGGVFLPIIFALTPDEIRYILEDSRAAAVITDKEHYPKVEEAAKGLKSIQKRIVKSHEASDLETISFDDLIARSSDQFPMVGVGSDQLAVLMYTSGTTGSPKGVMLSHGNLGSNMEAGAKIWITGPDDIMLLPLPLNHIYGLLIMNECYMTGARLILHKWFDPHLVLDSITRHKATLFAGVPTMFIKLVETLDPKVHSTDSVHRWMTGGAPMSPETERLVESKLGPYLVQGYGLTEAAPTITRQREGPGRKVGSVGEPIEGIEVKIVDEQNRTLAPGQWGEVCMRGPNAMKGYLNREKETREALKNGWLHTGDIGYVDEDSSLFITDRKKDLIIRGGENISAGAVDDILYKHPAVLEAAALGVPDPLYGEEVKAFVVLRSGHDCSEQTLIDHCLKFTPRFKAPKSITFLDELPKNSVGKILKRALRDS